MRFNGVQFTHRAERFLEAHPDADCDEIKSRAALAAIANPRYSAAITDKDLRRAVRRAGMRLSDES